VLQNHGRVRLDYRDSVMAAFAAAMAAGVRVLTGGHLREAAECTPSAQREHEAQQDGDKPAH
jgi:hypothetical protein